MNFLCLIFLLENKYKFVNSKFFKIVNVDLVIEKNESYMQLDFFSYSSFKFSLAKVIQLMFAKHNANTFVSKKKTVTTTE